MTLYQKFVGLSAFSMDIVELRRSAFLRFSMLDLVSQPILVRSIVGVPNGSNAVTDPFEGGAAFFRTFEPDTRMIYFH